MIIHHIFRFLLRRPSFKGQDRLFNYLFTNQKLIKQDLIVEPLNGDFKIKCKPTTWIGAKVIYTGDYEPELKKVFKSVIRKGDSILDIGANIGFHTLYFADLTGADGNVTAFEPVPSNFDLLISNINRNQFQNIYPKNIALSNKNEVITIAADVNSSNPGAYHLFDQSGDIPIECKIGDEVIANKKIDFIKIDVEGFESFVIDGLLNCIKINQPKIVFEYDQFYHQKTGRADDYIFTLLSSLGYQLYLVRKDGPQLIINFKNLKSGNILALPNA